MDEYQDRAKRVVRNLCSNPSECTDDDCLSVRAIAEELRDCALGSEELQSYRTVAKENADIANERAKIIIDLKVQLKAAEKVLDAVKIFRMQLAFGTADGNTMVAALNEYAAGIKI